MQAEPSLSDRIHAFRRRLEGRAHRAASHQRQGEPSARVDRPPRRKTGYSASVEAGHEASEVDDRRLEGVCGPEGVVVTLAALTGSICVPESPVGFLVGTVWRSRRRHHRQGGRPICRRARKMPFCQLRNGTRFASKLKPSSRPPRSGRSSPKRDRRRSARSSKRPARGRRRSSADIYSSNRYTCTSYGANQSVKPPFDDGDRPRNLAARQTRQRRRVLDVLEQHLATGHRRSVGLLRQPHEIDLRRKATWDAARSRRDIPSRCCAGRRARCPSGPSSVSRSPSRCRRPAQDAAGVTSAP